MLLRSNFKSIFSLSKRYITNYAWGTELEDRYSDFLITPSFTLKYADVLSVRKSITIPPSPLDFSPRLSTTSGIELYLKKENCVPTSTYKIRGALAKIASLSQVQREKGVVVASSGNFAIAMAYACKAKNVPCTVVFHKGVYPTQIKTSEKYGANVVLHGKLFTETIDKAQSIANETGAMYVCPHNDRFVAAGYGSVALELLSQNPYLDAIILPVGGASLLAATAMVVNHVNPRIQIFGVDTEIESTDSLHAMLYGEKNIAHPVGSPLQIISSCVKDILYADEVDRCSAILSTMEAEKSVVQGSGINAVATCLSNKIFSDKFAGKAVAAVCTGGNIESSLLGRVIDKALVNSGRVARMKVTVPDSVQQLADLTDILSLCKANIKHINVERAFVNASIGYTQYLFTIEIRGFDHLEEIIASMNRSGYDKIVLDGK